MPDGFEPDAPEDGRRSRPRTLSLGDAWVLDQLMHKSGLWDVVDEVPWANRDTPRAMVAFYMCSRLANCHAEEWWRTSVASLLWPGARLDSQGVSEFLEKVGSRESTLAFRESHARLVLGGLGDDTNVMIDSTGPPNGSGTCPARADAREGRAGVEARPAVVAQGGTAIHLWWELLPGSASDAMSFRRIIARCEGIGVHVDSCLIDELHKLLAGAGRKRPGAGRACEGLENQGVFALLSGTPHEAGDILPERCVRKGIEQPDDVARGHARLLPTRRHTVETLAGHVLLSTMGSSVMRLARIRPDDGEASSPRARGP